MPRQEIKITEIKLDQCLQADTNYRGLAHFQVADFILLLENKLYAREFFFLDTTYQENLIRAGFFRSVEFRQENKMLLS